MLIYNFHINPQYTKMKRFHFEFLYFPQARDGKKARLFIRRHDRCTNLSEWEEKKVKRNVQYEKIKASQMSKRFF